MVLRHHGWMQMIVRSSFDALSECCHSVGSGGTGTGHNKVVPLPSPALVDVLGGVTSTPMIRATLMGVVPWPMIRTTLMGVVPWPIPKLRHHPEPSCTQVLTGPCSWVSGLGWGLMGVVPWPIPMIRRCQGSAGGSPAGSTRTLRRALAAIT